MAAVERALRDGVEQPECRNHGAGRQHLDLEVAAGHVVDLLGVVLREFVEDVLRRPGRLPAHADRAACAFAIIGKPSAATPAAAPPARPSQEAAARPAPSSCAAECDLLRSLRRVSSKGRSRAVASKDASVAALFCAVISSNQRARANTAAPAPIPTGRDYSRPAQGKYCTPAAPYPSSARPASAIASREVGRGVSGERRRPRDRPRVNRPDRVPLHRTVQCADTTTAHWRTDTSATASNAWQMASPNRKIQVTR